MEILFMSQLRFSLFLYRAFLLGMNQFAESTLAALDLAWYANRSDESQCEADHLFTKSDTFVDLSRSKMFADSVWEPFSVVTENEQVSMRTNVEQMGGSKYFLINFLNK